MNEKGKKINLLVAAGGTGGHLFPAMAVVEELEKILGDDFRAIFTGTAHRIEGTVIPQKGYEFFPMDISGLTKLVSFNTLKLPLKILNAIKQTRKIIREKNISAVLCTGAYISYAPGIAAFREKVPLYLMESNVNPGKAINSLTPKASLIFTSFEESQAYFKKEYFHKLIYSGNPVRSSILNIPDKIQAKKFFNLDENKQVILIFGGSLGAKSINNAIESNLDNYSKLPFSILWQTGSNYKISKKLPKNVIAMNFIDDMASAYSAADLVVSRSGATTVAELTVCGKPSILIPLPSASNNEQKHNAKIMQNNLCSLMLDNIDLQEKLFINIVELMNNEIKLKEMGANANNMAKPNAGNTVANEIINHLKLRL